MLINVGLFWPPTIKSLATALIRTRIDKALEAALADGAELVHGDR